MNFPLKRTRDNEQDSTTDTSHAETLRDESLHLHLLSCQKAARHTFSNNLRMPWENVFVGPLENVEKKFEVPKPVKELIPIARAVGAKTGDFCANLSESAFKKAGLRVLKSCDERLWSERLSAGRKAAVRKWTTLVVSEPSAWDIAIRHFSGGKMMFDPCPLAESIKDALSSKASSTRQSRANPLFRFMAFCNQSGLKAWPIMEAAVYTFLKSRDDFAPTFPRSLLVSISFARHALGLRGEIDLTMSGRTKGVSHAWFVRKRNLLQRPPLSVAQLTRLEDIVGDERRAPQDRIAAGFFCFVAYSRSRYSDALNVTDLKLDVVVVNGKKPGFIEAQTNRVKTSLTLQKKTMFLPISAPINSVAGSDWASTWVRLRASEGLHTGSGKREFVA